MNTNHIKEIEKKSAPFNFNRQNLWTHSRISISSEEVLGRLPDIEDAFQEEKKIADSWNIDLTKCWDMAISTLRKTTALAIRPRLFDKPPMFSNATIDLACGYPIWFSVLGGNVEAGRLFREGFIAPFLRKFEPYLNWYIQAIDLETALNNPQYLLMLGDRNSLLIIEDDLNIRANIMATYLPSKYGYNYFQYKFLEMMGEGIAI